MGLNEETIEGYYSGDFTIIGEFQTYAGFNSMPTVLYLPYKKGVREHLKWCGESVAEAFHFGGEEKVLWKSYLF